MRKQILAALLALMAVPAWAAGTCVVSDVTSTQNASNRVPDSGVVIVTLTCTGDASTGSFPGNDRSVDRALPVELPQCVQPDRVLSLSSRENSRDHPAHR